MGVGDVISKGILSAGDKKRIVAAITEAEAKTSGEIRVHVESRCGGDAFERARLLFEKLGMTATAGRSGVLIYLAWKDRKLAVLGDSGIHEKVGGDYWNGIVEMIVADFHEGRFGDGLVKAVTEVGRRLAEHFPRKTDDRNELSNEVVETE